MAEEPCVRRLSGGDIDAFLPELARLRIRVFREYPYLYEGSAAYEEKYLKTYANVPESVMVLVLSLIHICIWWIGTNLAW